VDLLRQHAGSTHDLNPNRTRDNLDLLRFSLRSVARHAPWIRNIHFLTCRPQVPDWLNRDHPRVRIHHHDEVFDARSVPSFNSFAIITHLHLLPGLTDRFLYMEDDMLLGAPVTAEDFMDADGRLWLFPRRRDTVDARLRADQKSSPWNASLAHANHLLNERYGIRRRPYVNHVPLMIDRALWARMLATWPKEIEATRASRFRSVGNVAPEHLYPYFALGEDRARTHPVSKTYRDALYFPLENIPGHAALMGCFAAWRRPRFITMNDNFGATPRARTVAGVRRMLLRWWPDPSPFEGGYQPV
jgi:hypothetical protein